MCQHMRFAPDIFHCHDWHTALIPLYLRTIYSWDKLFAATRSVLTIHNIGYQGVFPANIIGDLNLATSNARVRIAGREFTIKKEFLDDLREQHEPYAF